MIQAGSARERMMALCDLLEREGIEVESCYETPWTDGQWHHLDFTGDDTTGTRAAQLAMENGYHPVELHGVWKLRESGRTEWAMFFHNESEDGNVSEE